MNKQDNNYHEFNGHFKYNDLFNELFTIKDEYEKKGNCKRYDLLIICPLYLI